MWGLGFNIYGGMLLRVLEMVDMYGVGSVVRVYSSA